MDPHREHPAAGRPDGLRWPARGSGGAAPRVSRRRADLHGRHGGGRRSAGHADDDRRARRPGCGGGAHDAHRGGDNQRRVLEGAARHGPRHPGRWLGFLRRARTGARRPAHQHRLAARVPDQRSARDRHDPAHPVVHAGAAARGRHGSADRLCGHRGLRVGHRVARVRAQPGPVGRLGLARDHTPAGGGRGAVRGLRVDRDARQVPAARIFGSFGTRTSLLPTSASCWPARSSSAWASCCPSTCCW